MCSLAVLGYFYLVISILVPTASRDGLALRRCWVLLQGAALLALWMIAHVWGVALLALLFPESKDKDNDLSL